MTDEYPRWSARIGEPHKPPTANELLERLRVPLTGRVWHPNVYYMSAEMAKLLHKASK